MTDNSDLPKMTYREFAAWVRARDRARDWKNHAERDAAGKVALGLRAIENNDPVPKILVAGLAEDVVALMRARS